MQSMQEQLSTFMCAAFEAAGYDASYGLVRPSDRPDLCDYQCNGAMAAARTYKKAPAVIAEDVLQKLPAEAPFSAELVNPGFLNLHLKEAFLADVLTALAEDAHLAVPQAAKPKKILVDYGGPNVAKPLHIGHLRSAVIGEAIKRLGRAVGHEVLGDIHLGDWGLQMGLVIAGLRAEQPDLLYFSPDAPADEAAYPAEAPFTVSDLERIYPAASARAKEDEAFHQEAMEATHALQEGKPAYRALWKKIMALSIEDLKKNYDRLDVSFDLWKGESDVQDYIPAMLDRLKKDGIARVDDGALIVDVAEEGDKKEIPPCIIQKSDGASLYSTTDLATLVERRKLFDPDLLIYLTDKRQALHFTQVFRVAKKAGIVDEKTELVHIGFGTMNGKDGQAFKTRAGGVMRLETLLDETKEEMIGKISENRNVRAEDVESTAEMVALAAIKYGDLSNQAAKDYIFDIEKFTSFEGNTGPYILYTIVRIRSILKKAATAGYAIGKEMPLATSPSVKNLELILARYGQVVAGAFEELAPHRLCAFLYEAADAFNHFYHETPILKDEQTERREQNLFLLETMEKIMVDCISILGFSAPENM